MKTNAARLLDRLGIAYQVRDYVVDPADLSADNVAAKMGMPVEQVFKTLLCHVDGGDCVFAVLPGSTELDLKKLALAAGEKRAELVNLKELEPLTGYVRGGVTVMGAKKAYRTFADETLALWDVISVSAGMRGMQLLLAPSDFVRAAGATVVDLTRAAA